MPISTKALKDASIDVATNPFLEDVWRAVNKYNLTRGANVPAPSAGFRELTATRKLPAQDRSLHAQAMALQDIMYYAAGFLTCKPPNPDKHWRHARWDALTKLMEDVHREAESIGVKLVDSPNDFRTVGADHACYWLEVIDPEHRDSGSLTYEYQGWLRDRRAEENKQSFWDYIGDRWIDGVVQYDKGAVSVVEMNERGNLVEIHGQDLDTTRFETFQEFGGTHHGWGIFAVTTDGVLHVATHSGGRREDKVRHTSLTGGMPVLGIGEIRAVQGKIKEISNLSGHYKENAPEFLNWLATWGLAAPDIRVTTVTKNEFPVELTVEGDPNVRVAGIVGAGEIMASSVAHIRGWFSDGKPVGKFPAFASGGGQPVEADEEGEETNYGNKEPGRKPKTTAYNNEDGGNNPPPPAVAN